MAIFYFTSHLNLFYLNVSSFIFMPISFIRLKCSPYLSIIPHKEVFFVLMRIYVLYIVRN